MRELTDIQSILDTQLIVDPGLKLFEIRQPQACDQRWAQPIVPPGGITVTQYQRLSPLSHP